MFQEDVEDLNRTLDGAASFSTMEGQLALSLTADGNGQVRVAGEGIDEAGVGNRLQFGFVIEQAHLQDLGRSLEHLLTAFPVIGAPDA